MLFTKCGVGDTTVSSYSKSATMGDVYAMIIALIILPLREQGTFALFELPTFLWGTYY